MTGRGGPQQALNASSLPERRARDFWNTSAFLLAADARWKSLAGMFLDEPEGQDKAGYWYWRRRSSDRRRAPPPPPYQRRRHPPSQRRRHPPSQPRRRHDDRRRRSRRRWHNPAPPPPPPPPAPPANYIPIVGPVPSSPTGGCASHRIPLESKCTGCPPMKDGKLCASTTWYEDTTRGSCGCGGRGHVNSNFWTLTEYTAAMNCASLDNNPDKSWCPANCGQCYRLCTTGGATQGRAPAPGVCRIFRITNRCGDGYDYPKGPNWCSQHMSWQDCKANPHKCKKAGNTNQFGYPAHFDLQDYHRQITSTTDGLDWDNAEVTFEQVPCSQWNGPQDEVCTGCNGR